MSCLAARAALAVLMGTGELVLKPLGADAHLPVEVHASLPWLKSPLALPLNCRGHDCTNMGLR